MNPLFQAMLMISISIIGVKCICRYPTLKDIESDRKCIMGLNKAIDSYSEAELIQTIQNNLNQCQTLIMKRSQTAKDMGLKCYDMFNANYTEGLQQILGTDALNTRLNGITDGNQRLKGIKALAEITNHMVCDEIGFRNNHRNDSVECLLYEKLGIGVEIVLDFKGLDAMMIGWQLEENIKNPIVGKVVGDIETLYKQLFAGSQECVKALKGNDYCRNVKVFKWEWCRRYDILFLRPFMPQSNI